MTGHHDAAGRRGWLEHRGAAERDAFDQLGLAAVGADRDLADEGHPVQHPGDVDVVEVLRAEVGGGPVVPERHAVLVPAEADGVRRAGDLGEEELEQAPALVGVDVDDAAR